MKKFCSKVLSCGAYLPTTCRSNTDLEQNLETSHDWIVQRTGIHQRHIADEHESTAYMGYQAAREALSNASLTPHDVDMIILATSTPDHAFPASAVMIQHLLGAKNAVSFDLQAACSGIVFALTTADQYIQSGFAKTILVIGAERMSHLTNWNDRTTAVLFGDGAGAFVLQAAPYTPNCGILSRHLYSDGAYYHDLYVNAADQPRTKGYIQMNGRTIYKQAIQKMGQAICAGLEKNHLSIDDIDWFVPHQANQRILESLCENFKIPTEKMIMTVAQHANTSAATIPLATHTAITQHKVKEGDLLVFAALGAGLTWGSITLRFGA